MSKNYTIPANIDWITLADLMGEDYDSTQYYVIHVNEITNGLLQYTCRLDMPTNEDIGQQFSDFSTIKVGTDVGDYTFLKATDTPIDVEVFVGSEDEPSPTPTPTPTGGVLPKNIAGLVMCLDGEINSREGVHDESINGMQNLVYSPLIGYTTETGNCEVLNGTPTFADKGCIFGGTCFYPDYNDNDMTIDFCIEMTRNMEGYPLPQPFVLHRVYYGGWQIWIGDPDTIKDTTHNSTVTFQAFNSNTTQTKNIATKFSQTYGEKIYYTVTTKFNEANSTKIYMNGELVTNLALYEDGKATAGDVKTNVGLGGLCNINPTSATPTSSNKFPNGAFYAPYLKWYMFRKWSRQLTPEEIKQNYLQDKKRFG